MDEKSPALALARELVLLRRRLAPPGSWRETLLRRAYVPAVTALRNRQRRRALGTSPPVTVSHWQPLRAKVAELRSPPDIVVLKLDHLGDFITGLPALAALRTGFPHARITLVCGSWNRDWAVQSGVADEVVTFDVFSPKSGDQPNFSDRLAAFDALALGPADLAIDLRHDPDTRPFLVRLRADFRAGFCAPPDMGGEQLDIALPDMEHLSPKLGTGRPLHAELRLELLVAAVLSMWSSQQHAAGRLIRNTGTMPREGRYAVLAPGAGSPIRIWPIDRLAAVGRALIARHDLDIVLTGGPDQRADCAAIAAALPPERTVNMAGVTPLRDLPEVIGSCALYVGYDTGATHLAAALGVPTVSVMGGIPDPDVWHAEGARVAPIVGRIACSSCYLKHPEQCPFGVRCLTEITVDHVLDACDTLLRRPALRTSGLPSV